MLALTKEQIRQGITAAPATLERLEQVVTLSEQRLRRAKEKLAAQRREHIAALIANCHARAERTTFVAAQHDDQLVMF